jgi:hypothetical protein
MFKRNDRLMHRRPLKPPLGDQSVTGTPAILLRLMLAGELTPADIEGARAPARARGIRAEKTEENGANSPVIRAEIISPARIFCVE